jgi:hypothetical protein
MAEARVKSRREGDHELASVLHRVDDANACVA